MTNYTINSELNGIEIYFDTKPLNDIITSLKNNHWRWHNTKKCWYAKQTPEALELAEAITSGQQIEQEEKQEQPKNVAYYKNISDYITKEEFKQALQEYYKDNKSGRFTQEEADRCIKYALENYYQTESKYQNLTEYIRQAIVWKSIGGTIEKFRCNGDNVKYFAIWDKLPTINNLKKTNQKYSAMWGYDQTQITTATYYGKAFGLDVLITGGYGSGDVLLKRIAKDGTFSESCMYFSPNRFTDEEIQETNEYVMYHGR